MADLEKVDLNVKYKLLSKLGQGSYGVAFRACLRADRSKIVVIKRVSMANLLPHEAVDAVKEAKLLDILNHPNVLEHVRSPAALSPTISSPQVRWVGAAARVGMRTSSHRQHYLLITSRNLAGKKLCQPC